MLLVSTGDYYRQVVPMSHISIAFCLALGDVRNDASALMTQDDEERLAIMTLEAFMRGPEGFWAYKAAGVLARYIDHYDIDMRLLGDLYDRSGVILFELDRMEQFVEPFTIISKVGHTIAGKCDPASLPEVDVESMRPRCFAVSPRFAPKLPEVFDRDADYAATLRQRVVAQAKTRASRNS